MMDDPPTDPTAEASDPRASVEAYRDDGGVVLFDARNPLAWLESTAALSLEQSR